MSPFQVIVGQAHCAELEVLVEKDSEVVQLEPMEEEHLRQHVLRIEETQ